MKPIDIQTNGNELYLDCNATTPVLPQIAKAVSHTMETVFGTHPVAISLALKLASCFRYYRNLLASGWFRGGRLIYEWCHRRYSERGCFCYLSCYENWPGSKYLLYGATEHKAVPQALEHWNELLGLHAELKAIPVDREGRLDLDFIERHVSDAAMICTMALNNETGVKQDNKALERQ